MPAVASFACGSSQLALAQAALIILSMGTFFPAEVTVGFAAVPCFLRYFWLVWLAVPAVTVGTGLGARGGFSGSHITPVAHRLRLGSQAGGGPWPL